MHAQNAGSIPMSRRTSYPAAARVLAERDPVMASLVLPRINNSQLIWPPHLRDEKGRLSFKLSSPGLERRRFLSVPVAILANMCSARMVHRTARIALRTTPAQRRRCYGLLRSAGDVWAWVIDCNRRLREQHRPEVANFSALCRELTGTAFGEPSRTCA